MSKRGWLSQSLSPWHLYVFFFFRGLHSIFWVVWAMQDHILPYVLLDQHEDDTLFIIAEEDFRFREADDVEPQDVAEEVPTSSSAAAASSSAPPRVATRPNFTLHADEPRLPAREAFELRAGRPKSSIVGFRQDLLDLVRLGTHAAREDVGDFIWLSWCGAKKRRRSRPAHGSTLLMLTKDFADTLAPAMETWRPAHFDILLRDWLEEEAQAALTACYVYPAVGSYAVHESGCQPGLGVRTAEWGEPWVQEGTRGAKRWLGRFTRPGADQVWQGSWDARELDCPEFKWQTMRPPAEPVAAEEDAYGSSYVPGLKAAISGAGPRHTERQQRGFRRKASLHTRRCFTDNAREAGYFRPCPTRLSSSRSMNLARPSPPHIHYGRQHDANIAEIHRHRVPSYTHTQSGGLPTKASLKGLGTLATYTTVKDITS